MLAAIRRASSCVSTRACPRFVLVFAEVDIGERLAVCVLDTGRRFEFADAPRRAEAAGWKGHAVMRTIYQRQSRPDAPGAARMTVFMFYWGTDWGINERYLAESF